MNQPLPHVSSLLRGRNFNRTIIILCVRWHITYKLSYLDLVEMMAERGVAVSHTTILRWVPLGEFMFRGGAGSTSTARHACALCRPACVAKPESPRGVSGFNGGRFCAKFEVAFFSRSWGSLAFMGNQINASRRLAPQSRPARLLGAFF